MGRKPYAVKNNNDKVPMLEKPSVEPSFGNPLVENLHNKISSQLTHLNSSANGMVTLHESTSALKQVKEKKELQKKPATTTLKRYLSKVHGSSVRRSERIKSAVIPPSNFNHEIEYVKDITASENEKDAYEVESEHVDNLNGKSLEEKVAYALQKIEALDKSLKLLKSKVDEDVGLYEALAEENLQLTGKLQSSLGKIDVYEKENHVLIQVLDKMKDAVNAVVISNLARTTEAAVNASTQAMEKTCSASAAKRKRSTLES
ncbi:PREDICTED: uncharacterized protein LOC109357020 isoform X2 [Lupinus angustifolius]|uniref:uncharacterized protein LOC109357020 isoform X2 n=1 Tax=Lupinus angustifolius TaxID=3871 RepID=UPI00092EA31C|nr:PREDICTED: uncharacterized protein LOC109357020 isoform X2 [Lupinus angustifolius]